MLKTTQPLKIPEVLEQICGFIQDALVVDYYVTRPLVQIMHIPEKDLYGLEFLIDRADETQKDVGGLNEFLNDFEEARSNIEGYPTKQRMLNGIIETGQNRNGIFVTNLEDIVTVLHEISERKKHFWTHRIDVPNINVAPDEEYATQSRELYGDTALFNTAARGPYINHEAMFHDLAQGDRVVSQISFGRRYTLGDLEHFVENHYKAVIPSGLYLVDKDNKGKVHGLTGGTVDVKGKLHFEEDKLEDNAESTLNEPSKEGVTYDPDSQPEIIVDLADFMEDVMFADYGVNQPDVEAVFAEGRYQFSIGYDGLGDDEADKAQYIGMQCFCAHMSEAIEAINKTLKKSKKSDDESDITFDYEFGVLASISVESIMKVFSYISEKYDLKWDKTTSAFSPLQGEINMDDTLRTKAMNILYEDNSIIEDIAPFEGYVSRDEFLKDVLRRAAFNENEDVPIRPRLTLLDLERLVTTHYTKHGINKPTAFKTGMWPQ